VRCPITRPTSCRHPTRIREVAAYPDLAERPGLGEADPERVTDLPWESDPADVLEQAREVGYGEERDPA
jgi:hypothetical protein